MNTQTVFKAGNSNVVSIPSDILSDLKIKTGDRVVVEKTSDDTVTIKKAQTSKTTKSKASFDKWLNTFMNENGEILDELAER